MRIPSASGFWFTVLILFTWSSQAKGQYDDAYLQPIDDPPDGVEVDPGEFTIRINENNNINVLVAEIKYTGSPGPTFGNVAGGPSGYPAPKITITEADGKHFVEIGTAFDFEAIATAPIYFVTLNPPTPGGGFYIEVVDINDNFPVLNCEGGLEFEIPENEPRDLIHRYTATDADAIDDGMLRFSLEDLDLPTQPLSLFQIDSASGVFSLKPGAMLDYEIRTSHRLAISVVDANPDHKAVCPMTIVVVDDVADEPPRWLKFVASVTVEENKTIGEYPRFEYEAVDQDRGVNSPIEYSVRGIPRNSDDEPYFTIDPTTGILSVAVEIDADLLEETFFQFDAIATEVLDPHDFIEGSVFLTIVDINDNPPRFEDGSSERTFAVRIPEGYSDTPELPLDRNFIINDNDISPANNQYDAILEASEYITDALRVSPIRGSGKNSAFSVLISDRNKIDYEDGFWNQTDIHLVVKIVEPGKPEHFATANIILNVVNINDNEPRFEEDGRWEEGELVVHIPEDTTGGVIIVDPLNAIDDDFDDDHNYGTDSLRYKWYNREPTHLLLDAESGSITVRGDTPFDFERITEEVHIIQVCDMMCTGPPNEQRSITFTLRLHIEDVNDESPTINVPPTQPILENQTHEINIFNGGIITVADDDTTADLEIVLEILSSVEDDEVDLYTWFTRRYLAKEDPDAGVSYDLTIFAVPGMVDREILDRVDFRLTAVDKNTAPGFEHKQSSSVNFSLTILDYNDNPPVFEEIDGDLLNLTYRESDFELPEEDPDDANREIRVFRAFDPDSGDGPLIYFNETEYPLMADLVDLVSIRDSRNRAILSRKKGVPIDREAVGVISDDEDTNWLLYNISIFDGIHTTSLFVNITVEDINDNKPVFQNPTVYLEVSEDADYNEPGHTVGTFEATDRDIGAFGNVSFLFDLNYNGGEGTDKFAIDLRSGRLYVVGELDRDPETGGKDRYNMQIRAIDNYRPATTVGSLWEDLQITIQLLDVNDNPPRFDSNARLENIDEVSATEGRDLGTILVFDDDIGENARLSFSLLDANCTNSNVQDPKSMFTIENVPEGSDSPTGLLVRAAADFLDNYGIYTLSISATDNGTLSHTTIGYFALNVTDVNLHAPIFEFPLENQETIFISRGLDVGRPLVYYSSVPGEQEQVPQCYATDDDDPTTGNGRVVYNLIRRDPQDDSVEYFNVQNRYITVIQSLLDREDSDFVLTVEASDEGTPIMRTNATIPIKLVPTVNTPPVFATRVTSIRHLENDGSLLRPFEKATDEDIQDGLNAFNETICYYIGGGDDLNEFNLDVGENILRLENGKMLDREAIDKYELQICAINFRNCPSSSSCAGLAPGSYLNVTVDVDDVNDEYPIFETNANGIISGGIKVDAGIGSLDITVLAIDKDLDDPVTYRISSNYEVSDPSLPVTEPPFELDRETGKLNNLFQPRPGMTGFYTFSITADDSFQPPHSTPVSVKIYLITDEHAVQFKFRNAPEFFDPLERKNELAGILTDVFEYQCNVERVAVAVDENGYPIQDPFYGRTIIQTHFINEEASEPVVSTVITSARTNNETMSELLRRLEALGYELYAFGEDENNRDRLSADKIAIYVLAAGLSVVVVILVILGGTCWFNNRSLSRRVRALTASTFGSQQSGLNRAGANDNMLPTTNQFAVQGSNPVWTSEAGYPNFDQESVGSGGSVLIGAEDEDYFNGQNETVNRNYASDGQSSDQIMENDYTSIPEQSISAKATDDMPNPLAAVTRRNPLMNLEVDDDTFM